MTHKYPTTIQAIRMKCLDCCGGHAKEVRICELTDCPLHIFRMGTNPYFGKGGCGCMPPLKTIRLFCLECCCGQPEEVRCCPAMHCPIHSFRFGEKPITRIKRKQTTSKT